jgi:phytoene dehydrogenase-like protein
MTTSDPTRSPAGTESLWAYTHVPQRVRGDAGGALTGDWDGGDAERFADRMQARIEAYAPVYVSAAPPAHVADTKDNYPYERRKDVIKFLRSGSVSIPRRYHANWIVVAKRRFNLPLDLPKVYSDSRFDLYRVKRRS